MKLHTRIFLGLAAGLVLGGLSKIPGLRALQPMILAIEPIGTAFIRLITMVVVPLVIASLITGIVALGDIRRVGRIGGKTLGIFLVTTLLATIIGLALALGTHLGEGLDPDARASLVAQFGTQAGAAARTEAPGLIQTLVEMIPRNPFGAAAQLDLLPLVFALIVFGAALTVIEGEGRRVIVAFFEGLNDLCMVVIRWTMALAPIGVFVLIAAAVARFGFDFLGSLARYVVVVILALLVHLVLVLLIPLQFAARLNVVRFFRSVSDAILLAFSTSSSSAALPVSMAAANKRLGISNSVVSFVLPSGTVLNKNGAAVYKAVTGVFIAQLYGIHIGPSEMLIIVLSSTLAAVAGAGVPGSSLVTTLIVLNALGLGPQAATGIALVVGVDRPLDMCRTTVNLIGNLVTASVVAQSEGEQVRASG